MFLAVAVLVLIVGVRSAPQFTRSNEVSSRTSMNHKLVTCSLEEMASFSGIREIQELVEAVALRKRTNPFIILSRLYERMRSEQEIEQTILNTLEGAALQELLDHSIKYSSSSTPIAHGPPKSVAPYSLSPDISSLLPSRKVQPPLIMPVPQAPPPGSNRILPPPMSIDSKPRHDPPSHKQIPDFPYAIFPNLIPPMPAIVHVESGDFGNSIPDVSVTVSPSMTIIEALRQAEHKYQAALRLDSDSDVIDYARLPIIDCYVINRINNVMKNEESAWKVTVTDGDGQEVYDDVCLPDNKEVVVKPGTVISLSYARL